MKFTDGEGRAVLFKPGLYAISLPGAKAAAEAEAASDYDDEEEGGTGAGEDEDAADGMAAASE